MRTKRVHRQDGAGHAAAHTPSAAEHERQRMGEHSDWPDGRSTRAASSAGSAQGSAATEAAAPMSGARSAGDSFERS